MANRLRKRKARAGADDSRNPAPQPPPDRPADLPFSSRSEIIDGVPSCLSILLLAFLYYSLDDFPAAALTALDFSLLYHHSKLHRFALPSAVIAKRTLRQFFLVAASLDPVVVLMKLSAVDHVLASIDVNGDIVDQNRLQTLCDTPGMLLPEIIGLVDTFGWSSAVCVCVRGIADRLRFLRRHIERCQAPITFDINASAESWDGVLEQEQMFVHQSYRPFRHGQCNTNDRTPDNTCFEKDYSNGARSALQRGGMLVFTCLRSCCILGCHVLQKAESPAVVADVIYRWFPRCPQYIFYDFGCALRQFFLSRYPRFFLDGDSQVFSDSFHWGSLFSGHKCSPANTVQQRLILIDVATNTEIMEQMFNLMRQHFGNAGQMGWVRVIREFRVFMTRQNLARLEEFRKKAKNAMGTDRRYHRDE